MSNAYFQAENACDEDCPEKSRNHHYRSNSQTNLKASNHLFTGFENIYIYREREREKRTKLKTKNMLIDPHGVC